MKEKRMRDEDRLIGIAFDDKYEDDLIEFIGDNKDEIGEYSIYKLERIFLDQDRILH